MLKKLFLVCLTVVCVVGLTSIVAKADIIVKPVVYEIDGQPCGGYFAINEGFGDEQPVVLLIHDWDGIDEYEQRRVEMLVERGYAAFAADLYGQGVRPQQLKKAYAIKCQLRVRLDDSYKTTESSQRSILHV